MLVNEIGVSEVNRATSLFRTWNDNSLSMQ